MSDAASPSTPSEEPKVGGPVMDAAVHDHQDGLKIDPTDEEDVDAQFAAIEMAGEEAAVGWKPTGHNALSPEVRYLHVSRTIHQLISDRNRSVGIYLLVASVAINASSGLLRTELPVDPIIPMQSIRYWCMPVTFGVLAVIGLISSLLLIRSRIGLIYEVTKLNVLMGLPSQRVEKVNPLSIFYLMNLLVVLLSGASAGFTYGMLVLPNQGSSKSAVIQGAVVAVVYILLLQAMYYVTILRATTDTKLDGARKKTAESGIQPTRNQ